MDGPGQSIYSINNTIGVSTVVYCGYEALSIPQAIVAELMRRADQNGEIEMQKGKEVFPGKKGDKIKFSESSPLFGFIAEIQRVDITGKLVVVLDKMLGSEREVLVNRADVGEIIKQNLDISSRPEGLESGFPANGGSLSAGGQDGQA